MTMDCPQDGKIVVDQDLAEVEIYAIADGLAAIYSRRCPRQGNPNEDAAMLIPFDARSGGRGRVRLRARRRVGF